MRLDPRMCPASTGIAYSAARCPRNELGQHVCVQLANHMEDGEYDHRCNCGLVWTTAGPLVARIAELNDSLRQRCPHCGRKRRQ